MHALRNASRLLFALVLATTVGCTSSPTEPKGSSGTPQTPKPPDPVTSFVVTVTANPGTITAGGTGSSTVNVEVHRSDNGQAPADGSTVHLTTTLGGFGSTGGPNAVDLQLVNGRASATLFASATETGTATVRADFGGFVGATNVGINQAATFFVSSVDPNLGSPQGGEIVNILGGGFVAPVRVTFNGATATVRSVTPGRITVVTPSAAAAGVPVGVGETASVSVQVTINLNKPNQESDTIDRGFTYALGGGTQQPVVFSVSPTLGTNDGGTRVTIVGDGFQQPLQVLFGRGTSASNFNGVEATVESVTPTRIVAITPAARGFGQNLTNQVVDILVKNVNTGFSSVASQLFKYGTNVQITAMTQGSGPYTGGTRVIIQGSGFDDPAAVSFAFGGVGVAQQVVSVSGTEIVILTSPAPLPTTCPANGVISSTGVSVTNIDNGDGDTANIGFNFIVPLPQVFSVAPTSGDTGSTLTITGTNFTGVPQVLFGDATSGSSAQVLSATGTVLTVRVPNPPTGFTFNTQTCTVGTTAGTQNVPTPINITVRNNDTACSATFRNGFLLNPTDGTCHVAPPPPPTAPTASFSSAVLNAATHTMQFLDSSTGTAPLSYSWSFGDAGTSSAQNPSHTYAAAGNYTVTLTVTNSAGSSTKASVVTVP
jgi:PKD domain-containing protein/IPT/TIG domain-containing protein